MPPNFQAASSLVRFWVGGAFQSPTVNAPSTQFHNARRGSNRVCILNIKRDET